VALEREVEVRGLDASNLSTTVHSALGLASATATAVLALGQEASTLADGAAQLASLASSGLNDLTAFQATSTGTNIWQSASQSLGQLQPAEQTWQTIASLSSARLVSLQQQWQLGRGTSPPAHPSGFDDAVLALLSSYAARTSAIDGNLHNVLGGSMPPPPLPSGTPSPTVGLYTQQVISWLNTLSSTLNTLTTSANAAVATLSRTGDDWAGVVATAQASASLAQSRSQSAQQLAAALSPGGLPSDATALWTLLAELSDLRVSAWPNPVTAATSATYTYRMLELDPALLGLMNASTGAATTVPLALLPVRLETRLLPRAQGGTELRVRVFVDDIHVNAHDPRLTADEAAWSTQLQTAIATGGDIAHVAWAQAATRFGPRRAAYLLHPDTTAPPRTLAWQQPARASCLPDRWLAVAYGPNRTPIAATLGKPITLPLQVGPDPTTKPPPPPAGQPSVDSGLNWLVDFNAADARGMALRLQLDGGSTWPAGGRYPGAPTVSRLLVVGVRAADAAADFRQLLTAHRYTDGLELIAPGIPTNLTGDAAGGYSSADPGFARSYLLEVANPAAGPPGGDVVRLSAALGLSPLVFAGAGASMQVQSDQQAALALSWPATWGYFLSQLATLAADRAERLRSWAVAWLRPAGPLPVLRVGRQPYGVLPMVALQGWTDSDPAASDVYQVLNHLLPVWTSTYDTPAHRQLDFDSLLERRAISADVRGRLAGVVGAVGSTPAWLAAGNGLLGVGTSQIQARLQSLPAWLTQIGQWLGFSTAFPWPQGYIVLPDWTQGQSVRAWPLTTWAGGLPVAVPGADAFLRALAARQTTSPPASLVDALASIGWARTSGAATSRAVFVPRGALGETAEPPPPNAADELSGAVSYLAGRTDDLSDVFGGTLDVASHRLDAWATALASQRLAQVRQAESQPQKRTLLVGGFGWVEDLQQRPALQSPSQTVSGEPTALVDPDNAGYMHTPSLQHATTAAVLRSGYLTRNPRGTTPAPGAPFAIDISSRRARLAVELLDGVRQGQPLSVLLGYRFERALQEAGRADLIDPIRHTFPYDPAVSPNGVPLGATEVVRATDVVDGVSLLEHYQAGALSSQPWYVPVVDDALRGLDEAADAVADTVLAQGLHDSLSGSTSRAAATFEAVASGGVAAPDPDFLRTPRTGVAVNHRVLLPLPSNSTTPPAGWPSTPRGRAEPALNAWLATLLGDPRRIVATVGLVDAAGAPLPGADAAVPVSMGQLGGPLDILALAERPAELERLAVYVVLSTRPGTAPTAVDGSLQDSPPGIVSPLGDLLQVVRSAGRLLANSRAADGRDLVLAAAATDPAADLNELQSRVSAATDDLNAAATTLRSALSAAQLDTAALAAGLLAAARVGIAGATPGGYGPDALALLTGQAQAAAAEIARRQAAVGAAAPTDADPGARLAALLDQLRAVFGGAFVAVPLVTITPTDLLLRAQSLTSVDFRNPGQTPEAWIWKVAHVHQPLADLLDTWSASEALGIAPRLSVSVAQLPLPASATRWVGQPFPAGAPRPANLLSLAFAADAPPSGTLAALLVEDWVEVIPSDHETTGIAYHYNAPATQAPQTVLLAVPANRANASWSYASLLDTLNTTLNLAHARAVDYAELPPPAQLVLPALYLENGPDGTPTPVPVNTPSDYLVQEPSQQTITSLSGASVPQGGTGTLTVFGTNLTSGAFAFDAAGVAITNRSVNPGTVDTAVLTVSVDPEAVPGPRAIKVGTSAWTPNAVIVNWRPRADTCDTSQLAQTLQDVQQIVTVHGHVLTNASAVLTGSADVITDPPTTTDTTVTITLTIFASSYDPTVYSSDSDPWIGPYYKPSRIYSRLPIHTNVPLTLTVTPRNGPPTTFTINLDAIS